jgi:hypothetical protein
MSDLFTDDDPELRDALHAAVADAPPAPPLDGLLLAARRARRGQQVRRAAGGLAVAAALAVGAVASVQAIDRPGGDDRTGIATTPTESAAPLDLWVHVSADGRLVPAPRTEIVRTVADPIPRQPNNRYWGVVVRRDGNEAWGLLSWNPKGTFASVEPPRTRFASFDDWLAYEVSAITGKAQPFPVAFTPDGSLRANGATRIVKEGDGLDLGQVGGGTRTAAAEIRTRGERRWVLATLEADGTPRYVVLPGDTVPDFDTLVDRAPTLFAGATS